MREHTTRLLAALLVLIAACGDTSSEQSDSSAPPTSEAGGTVIQIERPTRPDIPWDETPEQIRANEDCPADFAVDVITPLEDPLVTLTHVAEVTEASALAFAPDGTAYIGTRSGLVLRWTDGTEPTEVLDLTGVTGVERDQGLLGLNVADGYLFINRTDLSNFSLIEAYPLVDGTPDADAVIGLLRADQPQREHNGGDIVFGPDGDLYLTVGDGGAQGGPFVTGRQEANAFGSLLRFVVTFGPEPVLTAAPENPFLGSAPGSDYTWVWGLRHPYRFSFDELTGDLWISDVGQKCVEEVTMLPGGGEGGEHLGWNAFEGNMPFLDQPVDSPVPPTFSYAHGGGFCAVIGGHVYRGDSLPELQGKYVFGDFCRRALITYDPETGDLQEIQKDSVSPVGFVIGPDDALYVVDLILGVWRVDPV